MNIQELVFNTKNPNIILAGSVGIFLAVVFAQLAFQSANLGVEFSLLAGFTLVGLSFGLTRNIAVPILIIVGFNTMQNLITGTTSDFTSYAVWILEGVAIALFVILVNIIINRKKIDIRYYAITGAIAGFTLGLFSLA